VLIFRVVFGTEHKPKNFPDPSAESAQQFYAEGIPSGRFYPDPSRKNNLISLKPKRIHHGFK
jgi:hypothetical protein